MLEQGATSGTFPISIKGVVMRGGRVLLLRNERAEWELPGGRIELGESPEQCVSREIAEETGWEVTVGPLLDSWVHYIAAAGKHVFIVTYGCHLTSESNPIHSEEHSALELFEENEVDNLIMPDGYKRSVAAWYERLRDRCSLLLA